MQMRKITQADIVAAKQIAQQHGMHFGNANGILGMDAQPTGLTSNNGGVLGQFLNFIDPVIIEIVQSPMKSTEILGEKQYGTRTDQYTTFKLMEMRGEVAAYSDFSESGTVNPNYNFIKREAFNYQAVTQWGEMEVEEYSQAAINYVQDQNKTSVTILTRAANRFNFFGVKGRELYGLLNDPNLPAPIAPVPDENGKTLWADKDAYAKYKDLLEITTQLITQSDGWIDSTDPMVLAVSPAIAAQLNDVNKLFTGTLVERIKATYPNLRIVVAPEMATASGELMQLHAEKFAGQDVGYCAFSEKLRAHTVIPGVSSWKQKKSAGTWGAIIRQPIAFSQMLGV